MVTNRTGSESEPSFIDRLASCCDLDHLSRDLAFLRQVQLLVGSGGTTPARACSSPRKSLNNLASLYRFARNPSLELSQLRQIRRDFVLSDLEPGSPVLLIHDPTFLSYPTHKSKKDRRQSGQHQGHGYEYIPILAADAGDGHFLGVVHDCLINADGPDDTEEIDYGHEPLFRHFSPPEKKRLKENHRHQMAAHVHSLGETLSERCRPVHVADMEFDDVFLLLDLEDQNQGFVIRTRADRSVQVEPQPWMDEKLWGPAHWGHKPPRGWKTAVLADLADSVPLADYKSLDLDAQGRVAQPGDKVARQARLGIGSIRVRLYRPARRNREKQYLPRRPLDVNVVVVREIDAPEGVEPLRWILLTNLPVGSVEEMKRVAWIYEQRWGVEEFNRLLKSGYQIEKVRLNSAERLGRWLIVVTIAIQHLMQLRAGIGLGRSGYLDDEQYRRIKEASRNLGDERLDVNLRLFALIAVMGGWLGRRRDPIGPIYLMRGIHQVMPLIALHEEVQALLEQVRASPNLLNSYFCVE